MDEDEEGGNIQMFNFQYFGFYPGYVTLHSKEGYDGAVIIGTNFSKHSLPKVTTRSPMLSGGFARSFFVIALLNLDVT